MDIMLLTCSVICSNVFYALFSQIGILRFRPHQKQTFLVTYIGDCGIMCWESRPHQLNTVKNIVVNIQDKRYHSFLQQSGIQANLHIRNSVRNMLQIAWAKIINIVGNSVKLYPSTPTVTVGSILEYRCHHCYTQTHPAPLFAHNVSSHVPKYAIVV